MQNRIPQEVQDWVSSYHYKIELHAHSSPASSCSELPPDVLLSLLHKEGFDCAVISNHFYQGGSYMAKPDPVGAYLDDFYRCREEGEKYGMKVLLGAEYRFHENSNDYLVFGVDEAFLRETVTRFSMTFTEFYETYHSEKLLILQAHPFRNGLERAPSDHLDGIESFNMHPNHNSRVAVASRYARAEGLDIVTVGTDLHHNGHEGVSALRTRVLPENEAELVALLRSKDYLFDIGGCPLLPYASF